MICGSVRSGQLLKVQNRTARKPYIEDKEGLEDGIPNPKHVSKKGRVAKTIKQVFSARRAAILTAYMPARQ